MKTSAWRSISKLAAESIEDIIQRRKLPFLVGGSGQYVWATIEGWGVPRVPPNPVLRQELEEKASRNGGEALFRQLEKINPEAAAGIDRLNTRRVIRALEISQSGNVIQPRPSNSAPYESLVIGLTLDRAELYSRIDARVEQDD